MPNPTLRQKRRAHGLCITCGAVPTGKGSTTLRCAPCAETERFRCRAAYAARTPAQIADDQVQQKRWQQKQRAHRHAQNLCVNCGGPIVGRKKTPKTCGKCREKAAAQSAAFRQRDRRKKRGIPDDREPTIYYLGSAAPRLDGGHTFRLSVDRLVEEAVMVIKRRYRYEETQAGREPKIFQLSRLVREIILRFENGPCKPLEKEPLLYEKSRDLHLRLDRKTRAIVEWQAAQNFNGNRSRALRAMIVRGASPRRVWKSVRGVLCR